MPSSCETLGVEPGCVLTDRLERERDEAIKRERTIGTTLNHEWVIDWRHKEVVRERDEALEECRQCRADIRRLVEVRDEALAEVERLMAQEREAREQVALLVAAMDRTRFGAEPPEAPQ